MLQLPDFDMVKEKYAKNPNKWNLSAMLGLGTTAYAILLYIVTAEIDAHVITQNPHPANRILIQANAKQLDRIEANQIAEKIDKMFKRTCDDPNNEFYASELRRLIRNWQEMTGKKYPTELLKC